MARVPQRKKRRAVTVPIASMGDIAFLLIIFFLVCSEAAKDKNDLDVTPPTHKEVVKTKAVVIARVAIDKQSEIYFDGARVDSAEVIGSKLQQLLERTVSDEQRHVQFKCDSSLPKSTYEPVIKAIVQAGGILEAVGENER
ncbi:MAG: ExbD/TolR family protein [Verrucomicrobiales bacterium]